MEGRGGEGSGFQQKKTWGGVREQMMFSLQLVRWVVPMELCQQCSLLCTSCCGIWNMRHLAVFNQLSVQHAGINGIGNVTCKKRLQNGRPDNFAMHFFWEMCISKKKVWLVATQIFSIFTPILGEDEPTWTNICQMGWFNHQLERRH